jgi:hypothetical protein
LTLDRIIALKSVAYHWKDAKQDEAQRIQLGFIPPSRSSWPLYAANL